MTARISKQSAWTARRLSAFAVLMLLVGCGGGDGAAGDGSGTEATTRALLTQPAGEGPATSFEGVPEIANQATTAYLPDLGYDRGDVQAPLKVIEFSDFGCGFCRRFHEESFPTLMTEFIETGMIEWKFLPFITGSFGNSLPVTEAAECALEQSTELYEALGGMLWVRQGDWKATGDAAALVRSWAGEAGVDLARFDSCLSEDRRLNRVAGATAIAQQLGVRATPTFWIVGYGPLQGALPVDVFQGIFTTLHAEVLAAADSAAAAPRPGA